MSYSE